MGETRTISLTVNGTLYEDEEVEVRFTLADFLRHQLGLTGTHLGCEHGVCGACTILLDGLSARSCLLLAVQADGTEITASTDGERVAAATVADGVAVIVIFGDAISSGKTISFKVGDLAAIENDIWE